MLFRAGIEVYQVLLAVRTDRHSPANLETSNAQGARCGMGSDQTFIRDLANTLEMRLTQAVGGPLLNRIETAFPWECFLLGRSEKDRVIVDFRVF